MNGLSGALSFSERVRKMPGKCRAIGAMVAILAVASGCGSTYNNLAGRNQTGAVGYQPAVDLGASKNTDPTTYNLALAECRQLAAQSQATQAQISQEESVANTIDGAIIGGAYGGLIGKEVQATGSDAGAALKGAAVGSALGALLGVGQRSKEVSLAARRTLDNCLENRGYVIYH